MPKIWIHIAEQSARGALKLLFYLQIALVTQRYERI